MTIIPIVPGNRILPKWDIRRQRKAESDERIVKIASERFREIDPPTR